MCARIVGGRCHFWAPGTSKVRALPPTAPDLNTWAPVVLEDFMDHRLGLRARREAASRGKGIKPRSLLAPAVNPSLLVSSKASKTNKT